MGVPDGAFLQIVPPWLSHACLCADGLGQTGSRQPGSETMWPPGLGELLMHCVETFISMLDLHTSTGSCLALFPLAGEAGSINDFLRQDANPRLPGTNPALCLPGEARWQESRAVVPSA
jgi:hypothetical protein